MAIPAPTQGTEEEAEALIKSMQAKRAEPLPRDFEMPEGDDPANYVWEDDEGPEIVATGELYEGP